MSQRLELLKQMLASTPGDAFTLFALAKEYEKNGDTEQALSHYLRLYRESPEYVGLYYHLGKLYEKLDRHEEAVAVYKQGRMEARKAGDQHSFNELNGALIQISDDIDD
jgi:tetratricopeptide (TPR) repeat protein